MGEVAVCKARRGGSVQAGDVRCEDTAASARAATGDPSGRECGGSGRAGRAREGWDGCSMGDSGSHAGGGGVAARAGACLYCALKDVTLCIVVEGGLVASSKCGGALALASQTGCSYGATALCRYAKEAGACISCFEAASAQKAMNERRGAVGVVVGDGWWSQWWD